MPLPLDCLFQHTEAASGNLGSSDSITLLSFHACSRWDTYQVLWQSVYATRPILNCAGNHEIESDNIAATINYTTTSFSYPYNYPFQSYASRWPAPVS